jgi:hypothetical protein
MFLEAPKSDNFIVKLESSSIFGDLTSLWIIGVETSEWRYARALAASTAILNLSFHGSDIGPLT